MNLYAFLVSALLDHMRERPNATYSALALETWAKPYGVKWRELQPILEQLVHDGALRQAVLVGKGLTWKVAPVAAPAPPAPPPPPAPASDDMQPDGEEPPPDTAPSGAAVAPTQESWMLRVQRIDQRIAELKAELLDLQEERALLGVQPPPPPAPSKLDARSAGIRLAARKRTEFADGRMLAALGDRTLDFSNWQREAGVSYSAAFRRMRSLVERGLVLRIEDGMSVRYRAMKGA